MAETGEEDAAAGGSAGRGDTAELRRDQPRLKFLLSRRRCSGSVASGFPLASSRLPVSSLSSPTPECLKGPRRTSQVHAGPSGKFWSLIFHPHTGGARLRPQVRRKPLRIRNPSERELVLFLSPTLAPLHLSPNGTSQPKTSKILLVQLNLFLTASRSWRNSTPHPPPITIYNKSHLGQRAVRRGDDLE